jgi:hypothetical protein
LECPECVAVAGVCRYHEGWADGWDQAVGVAAAHVDAWPFTDLVADLEDWPV